MEYVEILEKENEELRLKLSTTQAKVERLEKENQLLYGRLNNIIALANEKIGE
jgi:hypothetical protein